MAEEEEEELAASRSERQLQQHTQHRHTHNKHTDTTKHSFTMQGSFPMRSLALWPQRSDRSRRHSSRGHTPDPCRYWQGVGRGCGLLRTLLPHSPGAGGQVEGRGGGEGGTAFPATHRDTEQRPKRTRKRSAPFSVPRTRKPSCTTKSTPSSSPYHYQGRETDKRPRNLHLPAVRTTFQCRNQRRMHGEASC